MSRLFLFIEKISINRLFFFMFALLLPGLLVTGRLQKAHGDFSYFIVAGTDFVNPLQTPLPVITQPGQGYDGQFFYRYALNPFDFSNPAYGIHVDLPPYRLQRIAYPFFAWLFSFGGNPAWVPIILVMINVFAFFGILVFTRKFILLTGGNLAHQYLPVFLCGLYMSLSRDLAEVVELFFFMGAVCCLIQQSFFRFSLFATLLLLTRETAIVALFPLLVFAFANGMKSVKKNIHLIYFSFPILILILWKFIVVHQTATAEFISATHNIGIPLKGIMEGFKANLDWSTTKNKLQLGFWLLYFLWQVCISGIVLKSILKAGFREEGISRPLMSSYLVLLAFSCCFSSAIYSDDWSFVRLFSIYNMTGFLILTLNRYSFGNLMKLFSVSLVMLTIVRLIVRV